MPENDLPYLLALSNFSKFGPVRLKKIKAFFPDWKTAFSAGSTDFRQAGIEDNIITEFFAIKPSLDPEKLWQDVLKENIYILTPDDNGYPPLLQEIYNPPAILYCRGNIDLQSQTNIAIIGSRKFTAYGQQAATQIARDLAQSNLTIVSGLALGIDAAAHSATLEVNGRTIAVLGSGLDRQSIYPSANRYLADKIVAGGGTVISEFPLGTPPLKYHFPQRNRIIAGLSIGTVVIEAQEKSGALITAQLALDQNREVFALPGSIYSPQSAGPNKLIKQGARPITSAHDIIETLDLAQITKLIKNKKIIPESAEEEKIISRLSYEPTHVNEIVQMTGLDTSLINSTLVLMEMKGMVKNLGGMKYILMQ